MAADLPECRSRVVRAVPPKALLPFRVACGIAYHGASCAALETCVSPSFAIQFLLWMLIAASLIAVVSARLRIPYTVALVLGGIALGSIHLATVQEFIRQKPEWLTPDVGLVIFLPALLFEGSLKFQIRRLRENSVPILLLAIVGVIASTLITGYAVHWSLGFPLLVALLFGAITAATDPISVLAIFRSMTVSKRLSTIVEGESLFNDGTAAVLYTILLAAIATSHLSVWAGVRDFSVDVLGGVAVGLGMGYLFSKITERIDEPQIEITLTTILAYSSYLIAQWMHLSGVIATVAAGLMIGNFGARFGMSPRTRVALWSFWEYVSFAINSVLFLLIGLQVHVGELISDWRPILLTIAIVIFARMVAIYGLVPISNRFADKIPLRWQHLMVWGGLRGALSLALALSLARDFPYRNQILAMTFGVVAFTIVGQGLTIKPLIRALGLGTAEEGEYSRVRVRQIAVSSALSELNRLFESQMVSSPVYHDLQKKLNSTLDEISSQIQRIYSKDTTIAAGELHLARSRLIAAQKSSIEEALHQGLLSDATAAAMLDEADRDLDHLLADDGADEPGSRDAAGTPRTS
jgi:CPA1 family monovalent cation:H+ antiporter